jgi:dATP pyrophosphohydrolase
MPKFESNTIQAHVVRINKLTGKYEYLLLQRLDTDQTYPSVWQSVTGTIDKDENSLQTALRELEEETGLTPLKGWVAPLVSFFYNISFDRIHASPIFGFLVDPDGEVVLTEHQNYEWLEYEDCMIRLILPSHKEGLKIFREYILESPYGAHYEINQELLKK